MVERSIVYFESLRKVSLSCLSASLQILGKLKGLALDAQAELERQDEALDGIATAVDRATLTIDKHNRRVKKLT